MRLKKIERLKLVIDELKKEFVGLDNILDQLYSLISPWYITPEVIDRPQVISLWGMTGTGKTSVVRRLLELLELSSYTIFFDCGTEDSTETRNIADKISEFVDNEGDGSSKLDLRDIIFVFDEFQYARSIDESGCEVNKPNLRPIWNLIDSGIISLPVNSWESGRFSSYYEDILAFSKEYPSIKLESLEVKDPDEVKIVLENLGLLYFGRGVPGLYNKSSSPYRFDQQPSESSEDNPYYPLKIIEEDVFRAIFRKLVKRDPEYFKSIKGRLLGSTCLSEMVDILTEIRPYILETRILDCSSSLVFILGNLDEAFSCHSSMSPDMDADIFYDETSRITIGDIKESLKKRFRAEQIARFGNSIIKYPTLSGDSFREIIEKEIQKITKKFKESSGIHVSVDRSFKELLYQEGVYPAQGVRPLFTTINTYLVPLFSKILVALDSKENKEDYAVLILGPEDLNFKKNNVKITIQYSDILKESVIFELILGPLRNPKNRKTLYINSVHECGHAIVCSWLTGNIPSQVISVSSDRGGFCTTYDKDRVDEIDTRHDIENQVMISLGGYLAEKLIYGDNPGKLLCGSYSDLEASWSQLSDVVYLGGYFEPYRFSSREIETGTYIPSGLSDSEISQKLRLLFEDLKCRTTKILEDNKSLLAEMSLKLSENGSLTKDFIRGLIKENEGRGSLTLSRLDKAKEECSYEWYQDKLHELI